MKNQKQTSKKRYKTKKIKRKVKMIKFLVVTTALAYGALSIVGASSSLKVDFDRVEVEIERPSKVANIAIYEVSSETIRTVTAYNVGDPNQTDDSPCIGAYSKVNLCEEVAKGKNVCAANFVPLGTELLIEAENGWNFHCIVWDRMNERFGERVDIAMNLWEKDRALRFNQKLKVKILKNE